MVRNVRPWGKEAVDIIIDGDTIADLTPHTASTNANLSGSSATADTIIDGDGRLALPGIVNAHAHVDKSW